MPSHSYAVSNFRWYIEDIHLRYKMSDTFSILFMFASELHTLGKRPHVTLRKEGGKSYGEALGDGIS